MLLLHFGNQIAMSSSKHNNGEVYLEDGGEPTTDDECTCGFHAALKDGSWGYYNMEKTMLCKTDGCYSIARNDDPLGARCDKCYQKETVKEFSAENVRLRELVVRIYNAGYHAGHGDTVEARYVHIYDCDMSTYHGDEVAELLAALKGGKDHDD
jgi:hypothetical protein